MKQKKEVTRLTIDLPQELHKKLKVRCTKVGKTMRDFVIEAIEEKAQQWDCSDPDKLSE